MGKRYHFNRVTGQVGPCRARKACPFGDLVEDHYPTAQQAREAYEGVMRESAFSSASLSSSLKDLNANELATEVFVHVERLGLDAEEISEVLELSSVLHAKQVRRQRKHLKNTPYIEHPLRGFIRLAREGVEDPAVLKAALLHDTLEDGAQEFAHLYLGREVDEVEGRKLLLQALQRSYGREAAELVSFVTNPLPSSPTGKRLTLEEKTQGYASHLEKSITGRPKVLMVKLVGDFFDNTGSLRPSQDPQEQGKNYKQAYKYLACVAVYRQELEKPSSEITPPQRARWLEKLKRTEERLGAVVKKGLPSAS